MTMTKADRQFTAHAAALGVVQVTRREAQIEVFIREGKTNKEIATALGLAEGTVKVYISKLYAKRGLANSAKGNARMMSAISVMQEKLDELEFIRLGLRARMRCCSECAVWLRQIEAVQ